MPAPKTRCAPEAQADLIGISTAHVAAYGSAEMAESRAACRGQGEDWMRKAMVIEARYPPMTHDRHMTNPD